MVTARSTVLIAARAFVVLFVAAQSVPWVPQIARAQTASDSTSVIVPPGASRQDLENLIKQRTDQLQQVNAQLEAAQNNLNSTREQKASLQKELNTLQGSIAQLELSIKSDQITADKLSLEVDSLNYDVSDIQSSIADKRAAVIRLLQELQKNDQTNPLVAFLKNDSLADAFLEMQSLTDLRSQLDLDIANLANLRVQLNGKLADVSSRQQQIEVHEQNLAARKVIVQDQQQERKTILAQTKDKESVYAQQLAELQKQQNAIDDEIGKIEDQLRAAFDVSLLPTKRHGVFAWPIQLKADGGIGIITQHFGEISRLYGGRAHNGLDIGVPIGTPVFAAEAGTVCGDSIPPCRTGVDNNDRNSWRKYQYGKYILIKHNNNLSTLYGHLSRQLVTIGETVARGQLIGYSGNTGYSTGAHLHFGVYWSPSVTMRLLPPAAGHVPVGVVINPEDYL
jgi:murein DD-endopeptidase MepM/ murein hydrolase activator NlpD